MSLRSRSLALGAVALLAVTFLGLRPAEASDIASFKTVFATDVAYAGYGGVRGGDGTGVLTVAGVSGTVTEAYRYWHSPTNSEDATVNETISFNGTNVTGAHLGISSDNCWGFTNSQAWRVDVSALVTGNGAYPVADLIKTGADINGLSLIVFFDDGDDTNNRDVVLFDGNDSNEANTFDADGWNVTLGGINYAAGSATLDLHVSDGQNFGDDALVLNSEVLEPAGGLFNGDTVPNGPTAGDTSGGLWDIRSYDVTSFLTPGENTLEFTTGQASDCLAPIVAAVNLLAGSAPNQPATTTTTQPPETTTSTTQLEATTTSTTTPPPPPAAVPVRVQPRYTG